MPPIEVRPVRTVVSTAAAVVHSLEAHGSWTFCGSRRQIGMSSSSSVHYFSNIEEAYASRM